MGRSYDDPISQAARVGRFDEAMFLQSEAVLALLTEIRDDQRALVQLLQEPLPEPAPAPCTHPQNLRTDQTLGARFWKCQGCGFVYDSERI